MMRPKGKGRLGRVEAALVRPGGSAWARTAKRNRLRPDRGVRAALPVLHVAMAVLGVTFLILGTSMAGCAPKAVVDEESPRCTGMTVTAGSNLTEASQYVEVRLSFDAALEAEGDVAADLQVLVNGHEPDAKTMVASVGVDGADVVVRLVPTEAADGSSASVYFALYDGLVQVAARDPEGGLAHVRAAGGGSNAALEGEWLATVPSGLQVEAVEEGTASAATPSVTFDVTQFAQLRCCTWLWFSDELPLVMMHNHEFLRDTERTCAQRLADTVNAACPGVLEAVCDADRVTVRALSANAGPLSVRVVEGVGANPAQGVMGEGGAASAGAPYLPAQDASDGAEGGEAL